MTDHRKRQKSKIIYDLLVSNIRSEENQIFSLHEQLGKELCITEGPANTEGLRKQIQCREINLGDLQHALDWYVEKLINDRRS